MNTSRWEERTDLLLGLLAGLVALVVYRLTLTPTVPFWDSGEFIACSYTLGIPHPPGTPLYVLLGRVFTLLPLGNIAERVNMLSAIPSALAVSVTYLLTARLLAECGDPFGRPGSPIPRATGMGRVGAMVAALVMAFSSTFWTNAIEAEVYALSSLVMVGSVYCMMKWRDMRVMGGASARYATNVVVVVFYVLALSVAFHMGVFVVFLPLALFFLADHYPSLRDGRFVMSALLMVFLSFVLGFGRAQLMMSGALIAILIAINHKKIGDDTILSLAVSASLIGFSVFALKTFGPSVGAVIALVAIAAVYGLGYRRLVTRNLGFWVTAVFVVGLSVHLFLLIRAGLNPPINEADPSTLHNFWLVISRDQYKPGPPWDARGDLHARFVTHFWRYWRPQYEMGLPLLTALPFLLGAGGGWLNMRRAPRHFVLMAFVLFVTSIGLIWHLNFRADEVRDRDYFFVAFFHFFAVWIGMGAAGLLHLVRESVGGSLRTALTAAVAVLLLALPFNQLRAGWFEHDRSEFYVAREYAYNMLAPLEKNAVLFTNGDNDTFPLWYLQEVEGVRRDVVVANLSLLNTDWYIHQLKELTNPADVPDTARPIPAISWTDEEIQEVASTPGFMGRDGRPWYVKDIAVNHIIQTVAWRRPIYIAVTVPDLMGYDKRKQVKMVGLAWRLTPDVQETNVDGEKLRHNLQEVFSWRGLLSETGELDRSTYRDPNSMKLVQNYSAAHFRLSEHYDRLAREAKDAGDDAEARRYTMLAVGELRKMDVLRDGLSLTGMYSSGLFYWLGDYASSDSALTELIEDVQTTSRREYLELLPDAYGRRAEARLALRDFEGAASDFGTVAQLIPNAWEAWDGLIRSTVAMGDIGRARSYLAEWLRRNPSHAPALQMQRRIDELEAQSMKPQEDTTP